MGCEISPDLGEEVPVQGTAWGGGDADSGLLQQICQGREVMILQGAVSPDHVHRLVSVPPQLSAAKLVQHLKGRSSRMLQDEFPQLRKRYWGQHLWARGYFCASVGAVDEETIWRYIENQQ